MDKKPTPPAIVALLLAAMGAHGAGEVLIDEPNPPPPKRDDWLPHDIAPHEQEGHEGEPQGPRGPVGTASIVIGATGAFGATGGSGGFTVTSLEWSGVKPPKV